MVDEASGAPDRVRVDRWLWAARFFKTRSLATAAVDGGKVQVGGERVKPSRALRVGDVLAIRVGSTVWTVTVRGLSDRRGSAPLARLLYEESEASRAAREAEAGRRRALWPGNPLPGARPTKRDRREFDRLLAGTDTGGDGSDPEDDGDEGDDEDDDQEPGR